jgi:hypothetical protein
MSAKAAAEKTKKATSKKGKAAKTWERPKGEKAKATRPRTEKTKPEAPEPKQATGSDEICVFAIRLRRSERDLIHEVAGSGKASKFVKGVALAAARGDLDTVKAIIEGDVPAGKAS